MVYPNSISPVPEGLEGIEAQKTLFWRYQKGKTEDHLATIEAVYFFCRQFHEALHGSGAPGWPRYDGRYDDLLYYYSYQYELVQRVYRERLTAAAGPEQEEEARHFGDELGGCVKLSS